MPDYIPPQNKKDSELTYRMSLLPFGTYSNPNGGNDTLGFAVPGFIEEPLNALTRLFGSGNFAKGPDYPGNSEDMRTLLFSLYGGNALNPAAAIPKGGLASGALREAAESAPQRMYHGTSAAEDFSTFRPSESGSFGPGVYVSRDPGFAGTFAPEGTGARMLPLDVDGPLATMDQYLKTLHANGRNPEAAQKALLDQGFTGVSGDIGGSKFSDVTNIFKPGSIRSATTGETLFSDTGLPSIWGSALSSQPSSPQGQVTPGNIDLGARPVVANPDGSYSTVRSISVGDNGKTVLIPTVSDDGRIMSNQDAIQQYLHSGRHLGIFDSQANADAYGERLHEDQARRYTPQMALPTTVVPTLPEAGAPYAAPRNGLLGSALYDDQEPRNALMTY